MAGRIQERFGDRFFYSITLVVLLFDPLAYPEQTLFLISR